MARWLWLATGVVVTVSGIVFFALGLDKADKVGSVVSALLSLIGIVVAIWSARRPQSPQARLGRITVINSGSITRGGDGLMVTGVEGAGQSAHQIVVRQSGSVDGAGDGDSVTGVRWTS